MAETLQDQTDEDLMDKISKGHKLAYNVLAKRHLSTFYKVAYSVTNNASDAEDAVQKGFMNLWVNAKNWDKSKGAKFTTWFYRVVHNAAIDIVRKNKNHAEYNDELTESSDYSQEEAIKHKEDKNLLQKSFALLPERQRTALQLCYIQEMAQKDAAQLMGIKLKALESLLSRGKANLKQIIS